MKIGIVLVGGGGDDFGVAPEQTTLEIYSPPYLFRGARPAIASAPATMSYGSTVTIASSSAASIASVVLIRPASVTHQFDQNQRFLSLPFQLSGSDLLVQAPANPNLAPPGYYMLFIVDGNGVPSVASFVRLPAPSQDTQAPTAPTNLTATGSIGSASLTWTASMDDTGVTAYNVHRATTSGFAASSANRVARTTSTAYIDNGLPAGTYYDVVTAEDVAGHVSLPSNEAAAIVQADTTAPTVAVTAPLAGATVSRTISVSASATDDMSVGGVQFFLDGVALGGEDTSAPYSASWNTTTAANGSHVLTATARDTSGNSTTSAPISVNVSNTTTTPTGLVAAYGFNEGSGTTVGDVSGIGNTGTVSGATWTSLGHSGSALTFDGVNDWVTIGDAASLDLTSGMTLEAWVFPATVSSWRTVVLKETIGGLAYALYASDSASLPATYIRIGTDIPATAPGSLPLNTWTHVAATYDGTTLRLFVNGIETVATTVSGTIAQSDQVLRIGGNAVWGEFFGGRIDDVRIYNRPLTAGEIQQDMSTPVP